MLIKEYILSVENGVKEHQSLIQRVFWLHRCDNLII